MNPYSDPNGAEEVTPAPTAVRPSPDGASRRGVSASSGDEVSVSCDAGAHERCNGASCACSCHAHAGATTAPTPAVRSGRFVSRLDWDSPHVKTIVIVTCTTTAAVVALGMCFYGILLAAGGAL